MFVTNIQSTTTNETQLKWLVIKWYNSNSNSAIKIYNALVKKNERKYSFCSIYFPFRYIFFISFKLHLKTHFDIKRWNYNEKLIKGVTRNCLLKRITAATKYKIKELKCWTQINGSRGCSWLERYEFSFLILILMSLQFFMIQDNKIPKKTS